VKRWRAGARGYTLVEVTVVLILMGITLVILYTVFNQLMRRAIGIQKRSEGQLAVRTLLVRLRHELKRAISVVSIAKQNQLLQIPLEDTSRKKDDPARFYFKEYEFAQAQSSIIVRTLNVDKKVVEESLWLGGENQILRFKCFDTGENARILFQYYRVILEIDHYELKMRDTNPGGGGTSQEDRKKDVVHLTTTVYPRRVNMELRIEVPQEGGSGI
jgi:prepilin-type N-terminal cleavage/methylation domain-containing protein